MQIKIKGWTNNKVAISPLFVHMPNAGYPFQRPCFLKQRGARTRGCQAFSPALQRVHSLNENINYIPQKKTFQKRQACVCVRAFTREMNNHACFSTEVPGKYVCYNTSGSCTAKHYHLLIRLRQIIYITKKCFNVWGWKIMKEGGVRHTLSVNNAICSKAY